MAFDISKPCIVVAFIGYGTLVDRLVTVIADVGSFVQTAAPFFLKVFNGLVVGWIGSAFNFAENDLSTDIRLPAMVAMDAEILCVIERAFVIPVRNTMASYFFRYDGRIFTEELRYILET